MTITKKILGAALLIMGAWFFYDKIYIIRGLLDHKIGVDITKLIFPAILILIGGYILFSKRPINIGN